MVRKKRLIIIFGTALISSIALVIYGFSFYQKYLHRCDLAVMGPVIFADGIGRQSIGVMDCLSDKLSIRYHQDGLVNLTDVPQSVQLITKNKYKKPAHVLIFESPLCYPVKRMPALPKADVKIAYSMFESTKIPTQWVAILNNLFDAVAVPDQFLIDIYKKSGVKIPIFVVPLKVYLDSFLEKSSLREKPQNRRFVFGNFSTFLYRKNQLAILKAFAKAFGNDPNVFLYLNGRSSEPEYMRIFRETLTSLKLTNVSITNIAFDWKMYITQFSRLDCYVSPSKGEGFSIQPREALAMGIPTIVTDNTGQSALCKTDFVYRVPCQHKIPAYYPAFEEWHDDLGEQFECSVDDLAQAMKDVYERYADYASKAERGTAWVNDANDHSKIQRLYKTLVLPENVILCERDALEDGVMYTSSPTLYRKYKRIVKNQGFVRQLLDRLIIQYRQS